LGIPARRAALRTIHPAPDRSSRPVRGQEYRPAAALARAQMVLPSDQLEVFLPGQHLVDGRVLADRFTLLRIMDSSSSGQRSEARCRVSCRSA
jgi:hypothetical protein